ncbi:hypothetical protein [uncultured Sulfitobacter sp.]|uniref:hypothetical protein n=1 Tax=uncultured Sulfitobacter sp. TaxID=191468 RepID=UPI002633363F|nr:hypothetical protein [uncultured Sulfitobacter sp.]
MSEERWELEVAPTAQEVYEAMALAGRDALRGVHRAILLFQSFFVGFCAPLGATMFFWVIVALMGGPEFSDLPSAALPVTFVVFGLLTFWLMRQAYFMIAQITMRSRFGRVQQVVLDQNGISVSTAHSRWHSGWADVALVRGGKRVLVVGISGIAIPLPRHAFLGPLDAEDALAVMQRWQEAAQ